MTSRFKTSVIATIVAGLLLTGSMPSQADPNDDQLPDIGTTAGNTLSINQELAMGDFYVRQLRASTPLINDPLLIEYINGLGMRLVSHAHSVRTPFHFYLVRNDEINAFAFFGGNVDVTTLSRVITRGLTYGGRLTTITTKLADRAGSLANLLNVVGGTGANVVRIHHEREDVNSEVNACVVSMVLETRNADHVQKIKDELNAKGYSLLDA